MKFPSFWYQISLYCSGIRCEWRGWVEFISNFFLFNEWGVPPQLSCHPRHVPSLPIWEIRPWLHIYWSFIEVHMLLDSIVLHYQSNEIHMPWEQDIFEHFDETHMPCHLSILHDILINQNNSVSGSIQQIYTTNLHDKSKQQITNCHLNFVFTLKGY